MIALSAKPTIVAQDIDITVENTDETSKKLNSTKKVTRSTSAARLPKIKYKIIFSFFFKKLYLLKKI